MMSSGRMYGGSNVIIMGDDNIPCSANALEALLSSPVFHDKLHSKDRDLQIETKELETVEKKASSQPGSQFESFEKSEISAAIKDPPISCKHEDILSSGTDSSGILDADSPHHIDCGHSSFMDNITSSHVFEADQSDLSHVEEEEEEEGVSEKMLPQTYHLLKVEDGFFMDASAAPCNDMFTMEDQVNIPLWPWP